MFLLVLAPRRRLKIGLDLGGIECRIHGPIGHRTHWWRDGAYQAIKIHVVL